MEPRLSSSKKWTSLPKEVLKQIQQVFTKSFADQAIHGQFHAEGRLYKEELLMRLGYSPKDRLKQNNIEISIAYRKGKDDVVQLMYLAVDVAATMLDELFKAGSDQDFPKIWTNYEIEGREVHLQYTVANSKLEAEADRLLGVQKDELVEGEDLTEEIDEIDALKHKLGLGDDDNIH